MRNDDALALLAAARGTGPDAPVAPDDYLAVNPYCFAPPVSPHIAAAEAGVTPDIGRIADLARAQAAGNDWLVVEGAGGWLAPISEDRSISDLALAVGLPVLLVVGLRLGCLNHAQLTAREIGRTGLPIAGWVANELDPSMLRLEENVSMLTSRLGGPPLARFGFGGAPDAMALSAAQLFDRLVVA
jgi:dethiobiotin synthetase